MHPAHLPIVVDTLELEPAADIALQRGPGAALSIRLDLRDGRATSIPLGPAEAVAIACELLTAALRGMGREGWPPTTIAEAAR